LIALFTGMRLHEMVGLDAFNEVGVLSVRDRL